ncbi:TerB family tellurite resistance protein [Amaricoccus solimangrovi]|uniref:TerB family tellurite resistance protein n=1 Tax=Amaricoccus solimangrovi TaxID=2589815 RepID=A0A501WWP2_9RHOB|nr:TerB family tellurite resistance protein [Amaricoccus solimangrovi]TPE53689.1 TerB family tellurite resistance protein [Amaricoccus solimangrovi]
MFADLLRRLNAIPGARPLGADSARVAMAALMVRVARSDDSYSDRERARIDALLAAHYRLPPAEVARLRGEAEEAEASAQDTVQFTRVVKEDVPYEERVGVVETLWRVAAADGIDAEERGVLRLVANLLGVSDQESGLARRRAERG